MARCRPSTPRGASSSASRTLTRTRRWTVRTSRPSSTSPPAAPRFGYPDVSSSRGSYAATIVDWAYEHRGILGFTTELWDIFGRAGIKRDREDQSPRPPRRQDLEEIGLKLLLWNDRELAGHGFREWTPFEHPQLGGVEIGGWDPKFVRQNPPPKFLEQECHKNFLFCLAHAAALPEVDLAEFEARPAAPGAYDVQALVINRGYLPTNITNKAVETKSAPPVRVSLHLGPGLELAGGLAESEIGHLEGFRQGQGWGLWGTPAPARSARRLGWLVRRTGAAGACSLKLTVRGGRSGRIERLIQL